MRLVVAMIFAVSGVGHANAWEFSAAEDPMTDEKVAVVVLTKDSGLSSLGFGLKCWKGGETQLRILTMAPYFEPKTEMDKFPTIKFRVDKNAPIELLMMKDNAKGRASFVFAQTAKEPNEEFMTLLGQIKSSNDRIAVGFESTVQTLATGSPKPVEKFLAYCDIKTNH